MSLNYSVLIEKCHRAIERDDINHKAKDIKPKIRGLTRLFIFGSKFL